MTRYGHNTEFQQQAPFPQGGDERRHEQGGYQQGGYQQNDRQQYGQQQGGYQQGGPQQGGYQQSGYQQDGYQQGGHQQGGAAQSYYSESQHSQQGPHGSGPRDQFNGGDEQDGERGFMGAVAGGAAGAFGGHKIGGATGHSKSSTIIGALAGAFGGHKLQDAAEDWKDERDEKKEEEKKREEEEKRRKEEQKRREEEEKNRRDDDRHSSHHRRRSSSSRRRSRSRSSSRGSNRRRSGHYAGNFTASSRDIRLDAHGDYVLHASCKRENGDYQHTSISLNKLLENDRGSFRWSAGGHHGGSSQVTVQNGDTLRGIAARFNTTFEEIARTNNISNPDLIYPGQTLQVPGGGSQGGGGFGNSARDVRLVDGGQRLEGELSRDGRWVLSSIVLDERIRNFNGTLELV
ncbi:cvnh domain-containing [Fusarium longipes]|uniref:Cvnh domain-containing n=1 Tax=Fusarium longipes TaxID=694270 RepID=A0A395T9E3_9HYPO|nr:cvnh domain-containing [Fusarium longipes]